MNGGCFSAVVFRTAASSGHQQSHTRQFATGVPCKAARCREHDGVRKCSRESRNPSPNDSLAPPARERFFVGRSSERSKTILVLRRSDGVVELEPVWSYIETECVDAELDEEKEKLDVPQDGFCNAMCDDDHQQEDQFFECN